MNVAELFHEELNPVLRRLGARAKGAGPVPPDEEDTEVRRGVWSTLAELDGLRPALPPRLGGPADAMARRVHAAELMGPALYQSPYLDTMIAADLLAADGRHDTLLASIASGERTCALAVREQAADEPGVPVSLVLDRGRGLVSGTRRFVAFAAEADHLLVIGADGHALVPADEPGVRLHRQDDIGRGDLYRATLDGVAAVTDGLIPAGPHYPAALARGRLQQAAYLTGLTRGALELTVDRLQQRSAFDRPLAKQQAPAFRLAALAAEATAVSSMVHAVASDADSGADIRLTAAQALFLAADLAREATAEAVHLHGAAGLTEEYDVSVFYRCAAVDSVRLGSPTQLRLEAARLLAAAHDPTSE
ncbi:acyl-CoA dehydrogenase family protein [Streptomyces sp. NPDC005728]|uniref:acyl-CoA dehydrogenase family protein n=1 Tax=Streptomyces sp. NPDC005728 TaxID=3157054 RepID=UPI0033CDBBED